MRHVLALLFAITFIVALGCAAGEDALTASIGDTCQTTDQCQPFEVCVELRCVPETLTMGPESVSVEISPPSGSPYTRYQRLDIPLVNVAQTLMLRVPQPIPYEAIVLDAKGVRRTADLAVYGATRIPGRELEVRTTVDDDTPNGARFSLTEGNYSARIRPADPATPGLEVNGFSVRFGAATPKEFVLPTRYRRLHGRVTVAQVSSEVLPGAIVQAIGEKSRLESTVAIADEEGLYEVFLPDTSDTVFRVSAVLPDAQQPSWGYSQPISVGAEDDRLLDIAVERSNDDNRGVVALSIVGLDVNGVGAAVADAKVTFTATVADRLAPPVYRITGLTDARGQVQVSIGDETLDAIPLLRARYIVEVLPPTGSAFARLTTVLDFRTAGQNFTLDEQLLLSLRPRVSGEIVSATNRPVRARVELEPLETNLRPRDAFSEDDGRFEADLDPGRYLLVVRPEDAVGTGEELPVGTQIVEIPPSSTAHVLPVIRLPRGNRITGLVRGDLMSEALSNARVEMFVRSEGQTVSLGEAYTDGTGTFSIVLPVPQ